MIKGKELYKLHKHCCDLRDLCHSTLNRAIDTMKDNHHCNEDLCKLTKCCIVTEKLCDCIVSCCCNCECVGSGMMSEHRDQCKKIVHCCENLLSKMSKSHCDYLHCNKFIKMCKGKSHTRKQKRTKRSTKKRRRY